jgi:3-deoxy-D-manno-octulosonic-acid transferase
MHGSNPIESVALGKPTIIGPCHDDFRETVEALSEAEGIEITDRPGELAGKLLADPARARTLAQRGRDVILSRHGATQRHADFLSAVLKARVNKK